MPGTKQERVGSTGLNNGRERGDPKSKEGEEEESYAENRAGQKGVVSVTPLVCLSIPSLSKPLVTEAAPQVFILLNQVRRSRGEPKSDKKEDRRKKTPGGRGS